MMPRTNPITARAMIRGTAARMSASNGTNSSVTLVRMGLMDSLSVAADAYWTRVTSDTVVTARIRILYPAIFSFTVSRNDMMTTMTTEYIYVL
jgi:hypothetical protein